MNKHIPYPELEKQIENYKTEYLGVTYLHIKSQNIYVISDIGFNTSTQAYMIEYYNPIHSKVKFFRDLEEFNGKFTRVP